MSIITYNNISDLIIDIRGNKVILDSDVATIYGVETRDINKSVKNNPEKFPKGYIIELSKQEFESLRWNFSTTKLSKTRVLPKTFTEKGLYMLATILKSKQATEATIAIIETFAKLRTLSRTMQELSESSDKSVQKSLMNRSGELMSEILYDDLETTESETSLELNFAVLKLKHTIKKKK